MSTFKIEREKIIEGLFPEFYWEELELPKYQEVLEQLTRIEQLSSEVVDRLKNKKVRIGFHKQYKSGAGWTVLRNITLAPGAKLSDNLTLCLISHELFHLQQSIWMRLSVKGELLAWQYQQKAYHELTGNDIGDRGQAYAGTKEYWDQLALLSANSRDDLLAAQGLMKKVSPDYRSDCLPLFPLAKEIAYLLKQGKLAEAFRAVWNLITCR